MEEPSHQSAQKPKLAPERLKRRADFLNAAKGKRFHGKGFVLQATPRQTNVASRQTNLAPRPSSPLGPDTPGIEASELDAAARFGVTVTKKIGGAVARNRIRRRIKEALRLLTPLPGQASHDYVIVARAEALRMPFPAMQAEIQRALGKIDSAGKSAKSRQDAQQDVQQGLLPGSGVGFRAAGAILTRAGTLRDRTPLA